MTTKKSKTVKRVIHSSVAVVMLTSCVASENEVSPLLLTAPAAPSTCKDALHEVVQSRRAYDLGLAGTEQVRQAVLAASRVCGQ